MRFICPVPQVADCLSWSLQLMEMSEKADIGEVNAELSLHILLASMSSICCRVFEVRRWTGDDDIVSPSLSW